MKKIVLMLMFASVTMVMSANESQKTERTEMYQSRGQPQLHAGYNVYVAPAIFENAELSVVTSETYARVNPSTGIAAKNAVGVIVPVIVEGVRKVRDVDSGSIGETYNKNTDKRNAIYNKTTRFTRSPASIRHV